MAEIKAPTVIQTRWSTRGLKGEKEIDLRISRLTELYQRAGSLLNRPKTTQAERDALADEILAFDDRLIASANKVRAGKWL